MSWSAWQLFPVSFRISILMDACPGTVGHLTIAEVVERACDGARYCGRRPGKPAVEEAGCKGIQGGFDPARDEEEASPGEGQRPHNHLDTG
jgi:hypothetical protein